MTQTTKLCHNDPEIDNKKHQALSETDVLVTATRAYQQGKITKSQFMAVINALDEATYQTKAYAEPIPAWLVKQ